MGDYIYSYNKIITVTICTLIICSVLPRTELAGISNQPRYTRDAIASKYHLTVPVQLTGDNNPLQTLSTLISHDSHYTSTRYRIQRDNQTEWILKLQLNNVFINKHFKLFYSDEETGQATSSSYFEHCFYHGQLEGVEGSSASISTCNQKGLSGLIFDGVDLYHIEKDPNAFSELHMVYNSADKLGDPGTCGVTSDEMHNGEESEDGTNDNSEDQLHQMGHKWSTHLLRHKRGKDMSARRNVCIVSKMC